MSEKLPTCQKFPVLLTRWEDDGRQTLGRLTIFNYSATYECFILEPAWQDNQRNISCIPDGLYNVEKRTSDKYGDHFHVIGVFGRSWILIHFGNFRKNTRGCLLPGKSLKDIDSDGLRDVTSSKTTMNKLNTLLPDRFKLKIISVWK